ncbi:MAG TPA: 4'-phosphopantetheinyl transferase superfamily protein [Solirubrobacteraceae bacterium]
MELDRPAAEVAALGAILSVDERERAGRLRFERHRRRFIVCRAVLRKVLASRLEIAPESVRFLLGEHSKPYVGSSVSFNVAHSHELALIAVSGDAEAVGVDLELIRHDRAVEGLVSRHLSPVEQEALRALSEDELAVAFHWCWTAKEACVKAVGTGLSEPLDSFDVAVDLAQPPRLLADRGALGKGPWTLHRLDVGDGYAATLALAAEECRALVHRLTATGDRSTSGCVA